MAAPRKIDYERIEPGWRAGIKSPAQLAAEYTRETGVSVSHAAIIKHFKKLGVPRDLAAKVHAKADAMVMESMVTGKVSPVTTKRESEIVEESATQVAQIRISHRKDIGRTRDLCLALLVELEVASKEALTIQELADLLDSAQKGESEDAKGLSDSIWKALDRAMQLPGRAGTLKALADSLKTLVTLEREAWGLSSDPKAPGGSDGGPAAKTADDLTDDELAAIARRGRAAPAQSEEGAN